MSAAARVRSSGRWLLLFATLGGCASALAVRQPWARGSGAWWPWAGLLTAAVVGAIGLLRMEGWLPDARPGSRPARPPSPAGARLGLLSLAAALTLTGWVAWRLWPDYHVWHGTVIPWVAALLLTAGAGKLLGTASPPEKKLLAPEPDHPPAEPRSFPRWLEVTGFLAIAILAIALRVYRIGSVPAGIYVDETNGAIDALHILEGRPDSPFATGWYGTPNLYAYYMAGLFKAAGASWLSLKAASLIPAVLTVLAIYPLGRLMFGPLGGLSAMAFLAASRWHMTMSRWGWNETAPPLFQILATFFLLRGLRDRRASDFALGGLVSGLMMYTYLSSRLALATLGVFSVYFLIVERGGPLLAWRRHWRGLVFFLIAWLVAVAPIMVTHITDPFTFFNRVSQISVFNDVRAAGSYRPLWLNVLDHLRFFHQTGDLQSKHNLPGEPQTDPLVGALFVIGLAYATVRLRDHRRGLLWLWLLFGLAGGVFSNHFESPQSYRTLTVVPALALLSGDVLARLARGLSARRRGPPGEIATVAVPAAGVALAVAAAGWATTAAWESHVYFGVQAPSPVYQAGFNPIETGVAREVLAGLNAGRSVYVSPRFADFSPLQFLAWGWQMRHSGHASLEHPPFHTVSIGRDLPVPDEGREALFLFDRVYWPVRDYLLRFYPNARLELERGPDGMPTFLRADVSRSDILAPRGLLLRAVGPAAIFSERVVTTVVAADLPAGTLQASWSGAVDVLDPGTYDLPALGGVQVWIDDAVWTGPRFLDRGIHAFRADIVRPVTQPDWRLLWKPPRGPEEPIPGRLFCRPPPADEGLTAEYFANTSWAGQPRFRRITPILLLTWEQPDPFPDRPTFSIRFVGRLKAPSSGLYTFQLEADDAATLWIDGRKVAANSVTEGFNGPKTGVRLAQGLHDIRIDYVQLGGGAELRVFWNLPGGLEGLIPPSCLVPAGAAPSG